MCNLSEAIEVVKNALNEDRDTNKFGYYEAWKDAISKSFTDEWAKDYSDSTLTDFIYEVSNNAANNFLNTLINQ
jgi:hypothetical protein